MSHGWTISLIGGAAETAPDMAQMSRKCLTVSKPRQRQRLRLIRIFNGQKNLSKMASSTPHMHNRTLKVRRPSNRDLIAPARTLSILDNARWSSQGCPTCSAHTSWGVHAASAPPTESEIITLYRQHRVRICEWCSVVWGRLEIGMLRASSYRP